MKTIDPEVSVIFAATPKTSGEREPIPSASGLDVRRFDQEMRDWPPLEWPEEPIRPAAPSRRAVWGVRVLSLLGVAALVIFFGWLLDPEKRGDPWLFWPLLLCMAYKALWWLVEWANYTRPKFEEPRVTGKQWTVDVLTTACPGEPRGMILRTLLAMKAIRYPHTDYLCDEGNDPVLRKACELLGVRHVTRTVNPSSAVRGG